MSTTTNSVLLVSDEGEALETLSIALKRQGYKVIIANDGIEALEIAKQQHLAAMFTRVLLPGCNGYEISRMLKEWMEYNQERCFPIFLLIDPKTGSQNKEQFIATWSRADGCLCKPYDIDEMFACIKRAM